MGVAPAETSATIGRYIRYRRYTATRLCVDPENSAFFPRTSKAGTTSSCPHRPVSSRSPRVRAVAFRPAVDRAWWRSSPRRRIAAARMSCCSWGRRGTVYRHQPCASDCRQERSSRPRGTSHCAASYGDRYADTYFSDEWSVPRGSIRPGRLRRCGIRALPSRDDGRPAVWPVNGPAIGYRGFGVAQLGSALRSGRRGRVQTRHPDRDR